MIELWEFADGELQEKFNKSLDKVIRNLLDENTSSRVKRQIMIKFTFEQNEKRDRVA